MPANVNVSPGLSREVVIQRQGISISAKRVKTPVFHRASLAAASPGFDSTRWEFRKFSHLGKGGSEVIYFSTRSTSEPRPRQTTWLFNSILHYRSTFWYGMECLSPNKEVRPRDVPRLRPPNVKPSPSDENFNFFISHATKITSCLERTWLSSFLGVLLYTYG